MLTEIDELQKRNMRRLWIVRINAAVREQGMSYSRFVNACKKANIQVNIKMLADLAVNDKDAFAVVVEAAKAALYFTSLRKIALSLMR